ncbi:MAG: 3-dehydroquinate synthase family protein [Bacteroidota bacterium]
MKLSNRIITTDRTPIFFGKDALDFIDRFLRSIQQDSHSKQVTSGNDVSSHPFQEIFILVDPETRTHCLPLLQAKSLTLADAAILEIPGGEDSKSLIQAEKLWNALLAAGAGRNCLLVNLGGGVVSDLGGFIAAGYKRGISYINIPTTLMGQADAAIGGKTAVNLGHIKNQVGFFHAPKAVFIFPGFLHTLPEAHLRSGLAEIIKSILISDASHWRRLVKHPVRKILHLPTDGRLWLNLIEGAVKFKNRVVMQDYRERKLRKVLNFGHTVGHALEGFSQSEPGKQLLHGEAVAAGMKCAAFLSHRKAGLSLAGMEEIIGYLDDGFSSYPLDVRAKAAIMELMTHDKKNRNGEVMFTLISEPGHPKINIACDRQDILEALTVL